MGVEDDAQVAGDIGALVENSMSPRTCGAWKVRLAQASGHGLGVEPIGVAQPSLAALIGSGVESATAFGPYHFIDQEAEAFAKAF